MLRKLLLGCVCLSAALCLSLPGLRAEDSAGKTAGAQLLAGAWKRVGTLDKNGKIEPWRGDFDQYKLVTPTHFTWFYANPKTRRANIGFSGRCSVKGSVYTEFVDLVSGTPEEVMPNVKAEPKKEAPVPVNIAPVECKFRLEGRRWYHEVPGAVYSDHRDHVEVWERLKPEEKMF